MFIYQIWLCYTCVNIALVLGRIITTDTWHVLSKHYLEWISLQHKKFLNDLCGGNIQNPFSLAYWVAGARSCVACMLYIFGLIWCLIVFLLKFVYFWTYLMFRTSVRMIVVYSFVFFLGYLKNFSWAKSNGQRSQVGGSM